MYPETLERSSTLKHNKFTVFLSIVCILSLCNVEAKSTVTVDWDHHSRYTPRDGYIEHKPALYCYQSEARRGVATYADGHTEEYFVCEEYHEIPVHGSQVFDQPLIVIEQPFDTHNESIPLQPKSHFIVSLRKITATKPEPMLGMLLLGQRRRTRVIVVEPPAFNPVHIPSAVSLLSAVLAEDGHDVEPQWGHILGLEHLFLSQGNQSDKERVKWALHIVRSADASVHDQYLARKIFEKTSEAIATKDKFRYERNNVIYASQYQDGTIAGVLRGIADRENHLWYSYFSEVEVPHAKLFWPHMYCISVGDERQLFPGMILASMVKDALPGCKVIVGGNFFGRIPDPRKYPDFEKLFDHVDGICYAEGFQPIVQMARRLDVATTSGMIWRKGSEVVVNPRTNYPTKFTTLPTPDMYGSAAPWSPDWTPSLYTKSHCPLACNFCAIEAQSDDFAAGRLDDRPKIAPRSMTPMQIAKQMQSMCAHKFDIVDALMSISEQLELGKALRTIGYEATWQCYLTVTDNCLKPQVAQSLYDAGCRSVQLGLETLRPETCFQIQKQWNHPSGYHKILENFRNAGIHTHVFLIIGLPTEPLSEGLRWVGFLERYGRNILTIKSGRWRPARYAPEVEKGLLDAHVELYPDTKPFQTNRSFRYRDPIHSNQKVNAMRDIVEQACRRHWAYNVTSTIPWWINRSRYTWEELEEMAKQLQPEPDIRDLDEQITQMRTLVRKELGREVNFQTWDELAAFAVTLL